MMTVTLEEIEAWVYDHYNMHRTDIDLGGLDYIATFENGDTYKYQERGDMWHKTVTITINSKMQNVTEYRYHNFGWKAMEV